MKKFFLGLSIIVLMLSSAFGVEYGSREYGKDIKDWHLYTSAKGEVTKVGDGFKFTGNGTKTGFYTKLTPIYKDGDTLRIRIKFSHYFKIYVQVMTTKGIRYLTYYPLNKDLGKHGRFIEVGLGKSARNGEWKNFSLALKSDLDRFEEGNKILEVRALFIRGSGQINYIELFKMRVESLYQRMKLKKLLVDRGFDDSEIYTQYGRNVIVSVTNTDNMDFSTSFYTLSKDEKSPHLMFTVGDSGLCSANAVNFNEDNTIMTVQYNASGSYNCSPVWQDKYDISDIYNPRRLSHEQYP